MNVPNSPRPASLDDLLTEHQAAAHLTLSVASLRRFRQTGAGPAYIQLSPGRVAYDPIELKAWRLSRTVRNTAEAAALKSQTAA